jgi:hypothetical protein
MRLIETFDHWSAISLADKELNHFLDSAMNSIIESIGAVIDNPIKYLGIKKAAKEYQRALVTTALADLEYEKKKRAGIEPKNKEVLQAATKAKKEAMAELKDAASQKLDDLATSDVLSDFSKLAKTKARIAAAEIAMKSAGETETGEIKDRITKLKKSAAKIQSDLTKASKENGAANKE